MERKGCSLKYKHGDPLISDNRWFNSASFLAFYSLIGIAGTLLFGMNRYRIHHRHRLKGLTRAVTVSNHTMFLDPVLMSAAVLPNRMYQTLLEETVCTPFVGTFTRLLGGMPVPHGDPRMTQLFHGAATALNQRRFLHFYPEGECYLYNAQPNKFHCGAFITAAVLNVPVVPMATVFQKNGNKPFVHLYILEPMNPKDFGVIDSDGSINIRQAKQFAENVRQRICKEISLRGGTGEYYKGHLERIRGINA